MPSQVLTIKDSLVDGFSSFVHFIPTLIGALIVLAIGWLLSNLVAKLIHRLLSAVKLERATERFEFLKVNIPSVLATLSQWFVRLVFIQAAANLLNMPQVTQIINSVLLFIPNLIVAMLILIGGSFAARFLADLVVGAVSRGGAGRPQLFGMLTQYAVMGFAFIAALHQLGIVTSLVNILFAGLIASLSIAVGLAFGLGGQGVAGEITRNWYERAGKGAPEHLKVAKKA